MTIQIDKRELDSHIKTLTSDTTTLSQVTLSLKKGSSTSAVLDKYGEKAKKISQLVKSYTDLLNQDIVLIKQIEGEFSDVDENIGKRFGH